MAFCPGHSRCEAPISVITDILTKKDPSKYAEISNEFKSLEFNKVKDLANSSFGKVSKINSLGEDPLAKLYEALEMYAEYCGNQLKSAKLEYNQKNVGKTQEICKEMLLHNPDDLEILLLLAASYYEYQEYDTCLNYLNEAYVKHPNNVEVLNNMGLCYYSKSQYCLAFDCFKANVCKNISNMDAWINIARLLIVLNNKEDAQIAFAYALNCEHDLPNIRNEYAQLLSSLNKIEEAEQQYKIASKKAPEYVDTWINLGNLYMNTDKINEAIICYKKASELNNNLTKPWNYLGKAYLKVTEYQNAIDSFHKALEICPEDIFALKHLAVIYAHQQNWSLVIDTYKKVLKYQPFDLDTNFRLGEVYDKYLKNYQEAEKYFKIILNLNPQNEKFLKCLIVVYQKQGKNKCAYETAISLGDVFYDQNNYENAMKAYTIALNLHKEDGMGHWKLGNTLYRLGHIDSAFARYQICSVLKPNFSNAYADCGLICEEKNLPVKALDYYEAAHALNPNKIFLQKLVSIKEKLGDFENVIELNNTILEHEDSDNSIKLSTHMETP